MKVEGCGGIGCLALTYSQYTRFLSQYELSLTDFSKKKMEESRDKFREISTQFDRKQIARAREIGKRLSLKQILNELACETPCTICANAYSKREGVSMTVKCRYDENNWYNFRKSMMSGDNFTCNNFSESIDGAMRGYHRMLLHEKEILEMD